MAEGQGLVALGGEHLATLPLVEVVAKRHPQLIVVQLDAHTDLRDTYLGERLSHATVLRRVAEQVGIERVWQYGVRSGTQEEFSFARHLYGELPTGGAPLPPADAPVYLTVDIDVADPAYAPGTGAPEPGGPTAREVLQAVRRLAVERQVVALDVMEVSPGWDPAGITASLAAKVVREVLIARRRAGEGGAHVG
jgi:agmatinase